MPGADLQPIVSVRNLVAGFGGRAVLDGLDLDVRAGEILGVVGGSGAGKSVLLRSIIGLVKKRSGEIRVFDISPDEVGESGWRAVERRWGVLFQQGALFSSLTARENIQFPMRQFLHLPEGLMNEIAMVKLELVGLKPEDALKYPAELSGGMTKRVALARALALDPEIVFLDEPTSGLDPIAAGAFDELIRTLQQTLGITVFMVTHDLDSLNAACDRIAALAGGKIVAEGTMETILASPHPWVQAYFGGRRAITNGRGAEPSSRRT
jgi:phospholipid/cholesterol/gamma-HCH transport system ATP-binding protein